MAVKITRSKNGAIRVESVERDAKVDRGYSRLVFGGQVEVAGRLETTVHRKVNKSRSHAVGSFRDIRPVGHPGFAAGHGTRRFRKPRSAD